MFQNFPAYGFYGNPNLVPETSLGYDLGFEQRLAGSLQFGITYFHNYLKNLIDDNATFTSYTNIDRVTTDGIESFVSYDLLHALNLRLDYTFTQAYDDSDHEELLRRPKNKASLMATWHASSRLSISPTVLYVGSWIDGNRDFSISRLSSSGYIVANVAAVYELNEHFSLMGRLDNMLGRVYENPNGFLQPGRGAYAGVTAKF
jgi:vitamin B12 transporter